MSMKHRNSIVSSRYSINAPSYCATGIAVVLFVVVISTLLLSVSSSSDDEDVDLTCSSNPYLHPLDETLLIYAHDSISSTQDEAKRIAEENAWEGTAVDDLSSPSSSPSPRSFVVVTREQIKGRGTNGRVWLGQRGNVFVTICIRQEDWMSRKIPLTLLPLKIGSLVARHVQRILNDCLDTARPRHDAPLVTVKWPNDVLVNERKISGILIESSNNGWFLIGVGINVAYAPDVAQSGPNRGRPASSLTDICPDLQYRMGKRGTEQIGIDLAHELHSFVHTPDGATRPSSDDVLKEWKQWIDWDMELIMRDTPDQEKVKMVGVLPDGRVQVQNVLDGRIRTLVSDYFL